MMGSKPISQIPPDVLLSIRDLVADNAGLYFDPGKFYYLEKRILTRMRLNQADGAHDYYRLLTSGKDRRELLELIAILTITETYFYRNLPQLTSFVEEALPSIVAQKRQQNDLTLNIWSAACSSGEEAYTIAILLRETLTDFDRWNIQLLATDINHLMLDRAIAAVYGDRAVKDVSLEIRRKYFLQEDTGYRVLPSLQRDVTFRHLNLMDHSAILCLSSMDFIFCRNVLIYFSEAAVKQVIDTLYEVLRPGGFVFLGHAESVGRLSSAFQAVRLQKSLFYRK
jgi:chemotaxis protein methyltransferase CheR